MKIHFESNLQYQEDAINSVVRLFEGAPFIRAEDNLLAEVSANILKISKEEIFNNFRSIAKDNSIEESHLNENEFDFSVEMETGTGKTYVYLRTIFELNKVYGLNKFIIVVPSIAVKEGVIKTLEITKEHFKQLYNTNAEYFEYDSKKSTRVRYFAISNTLQIMVTNIQAFNTDDRIINQERDANNGVRLIDLIKDTRPIVIMDEPQEGMDSANMQKRFTGLNPLFKLRYSATHKKLINLVYQLSPYEAYNQNLVKKIEVYSVHEGNTQSNVQIEFDDIKLDSNKPPQAKLTLNFRLADSGFKSKSAYFKDGDNLETKTKNPVYKGWLITRILKDPLDGSAKIKFSNGIELVKGSKYGWDKESIFKEQIRWTIRKHFAKKDKYKPLGIKVLSLFFIDKVANYTEETGIIKKLFIELYKEEYKKKYLVDPENIHQIHNGYFAKTNKGEYTDNESSMSKNKEIYDLIMKDKERLLSLEEPLEFIFSHSALGVGWDNPNIFNICTLNESESVIKKRQEIGRGLRLAVTMDGTRYRDPDTVQEGEEVNLLTVIANQSYYSFAESYQNELIEEYGKSHNIPKLRDAKRIRNKININHAVLNSDDFQNLWKKISQKTKYKVVFRENEIIAKCIEQLDEIVVHQQVIKVDANRINVLTVDQNILETSRALGNDESTSKNSYVKIDLIDEISEQTSLSTDTVIKIIEGLKNKYMIGKNPVMYLAESIKRIKNILEEEMVSLVSYIPLDERFETSLFEETVETYKEVIPVNRGLYDGVIFDSDTEKNFALDINNENRVKSFVKLPRWYEIDTPIGKYNPDFALVVEKTALEGGDETKYYFVIETKGSNEWNQLKESEKAKIRYAIKHFEAIGLNEYLAPVENMNDFKQQANNKLNLNLF